jgi:hypothetical protein
VKRILLVHHNRPHFEIVLWLVENLRDHYSIALWSNYLHAFNRSELIKAIALRLYAPEDHYDYVIVISGDDDLPPSAIPASLSKLMSSEIPVLSIVHSGRGARNNNDIFLFPKFDVALIPMATGLDRLLKRPEIPERGRKFLVQGNIENRRDYTKIDRLARAISELDGGIDICGLKVGGQEPATESNVSYLTDLGEFEFHQVCARSHFILPLIEPKNYGWYFDCRFSSSILIGLSYNLPFVAHKRLFDLYPISGYPYETDDELLGCMKQATTAAATDYDGMLVKMASKRDLIRKENLDRFAKILDRAVVRT